MGPQWTSMDFHGLAAVAHGFPSMANALPLVSHRLHMGLS